jgi:hypothetical protein
VSSQTRVAVRVRGAILLVGLALFCGYGFSASYELGSPDVFHVLYGAAGVAVVTGAVWLVFPVGRGKSSLTGPADPHAPTPWRPMRLAALLSLFSLWAITTGNPANLGLLPLPLFLPPIPAEPRTQP